MDFLQINISTQSKIQPCLYNLLKDPQSSSIALHNGLVSAARSLLSDWLVDILFPTNVHIYIYIVFTNK